MEFDKYDKILIPLLCQDISNEIYPFRMLAEKTGLSEEEVIEKINSYRETGKMRRFGAIINHQKAGFSGNAMSVWNVPENIVDEIGNKMAEFPQVSHCYIRPRFPDWNYNLFGMIHSTSKEGCIEVAEIIAKELSLSDFDVLFSIREFKKSSMIYLT